MNTERLINESNKTHNNKYDYSQTIYSKSTQKIKIICQSHGLFEQAPYSHLRGHGCKKCGVIRNNNLLKKSNIEEFIQKAIQKHGDNYDYSNFNYVNTNTHGIIICKLHGDFLQTPLNHLQGNGCRKCGIIRSSNKQRGNKEDFINDAIQVHGNIFDYSKVEYINCDTNVIIICKTHGEFEQSPYCHLKQKYCCQQCAGNFQYSTKEYIEKAIQKHGDKYDYSKVEYISGKTHIIIICKLHGEFSQNPHNHLYGYQCYKCAGKNKTTEEYIEKAKEIHGDKYDYSKVNYTKAKDKIIIICKIHGDFEQEAYGHSTGQGCSKCVNKTEAKLYEIMKQIYPSLITQFKQEWCNKKIFDFCIPECKIIIELDGPQHFIQIMNWLSPEEQQENDKYKEECANQNGYSVIRLLQEDVFYDTYDWVKELTEAIEEIKSSKGITNIYLCKNGEYDNY